VVEAGNGAWVVLILTPEVLILAAIAVAEVTGVSTVEVEARTVPTRPVVSSAAEQEPPSVTPTSISYPTGTVTPIKPYECLCKHEVAMETLEIAETLEVEETLEAEETIDEE
jgi:hypothetical protein